MSRLRRLVISDRYFFVTCNLQRGRNRLDDADFRLLAQVFQARRARHGFLLTAWVFLPDHWHAIVGVRHPQTVSLILESIKVSSTRQMNTRRKESGRLWQARFFDRAPRTPKEYHQTIEYIHWNPCRGGWRGVLANGPRSSCGDYAGGEPVHGTASLRIDRVRLPADGMTRI
jgi:REP-associated tyrosine transposase